MDTYDQAALQTSRSLIRLYSTSFGMASKLYDKSIRQDIYNIYGIVRIADEIVDTICGADAENVIDAYEAETFHALKRGYSTDLIIHAFCMTANKYDIGTDLIEPFFESMKTDLTHKGSYTQKSYQSYIYGSAEVVGLMCLKVFCRNSVGQYGALEPYARALGSAFQKVNFLRDMAADHQQLGRYYFPSGSYETFNETIKQEIVSDIKTDFGLAAKGVGMLPGNARYAVEAALDYYASLLRLLEQTPATTLRERRIRINDGHKLLLLSKAYAKKLLRMGGRA